MASKNRHNAAFVTGAVLGGLAGAAAALWKTPYSGDELRSKLTGGESGDTGSTDGVSLKDKMLSTAENLLAPVVGVELGKTANESDTSTSGREPAHLEPTDSMGPGAGERPTGGIPGSNEMATPEPPAAPNEDTALHERNFETGGKANVTPVDDDAMVPDRTSSTTEPASDENAATVEELTKPQTDQLPDAFQHEDHEMQPFPKLGGNEPE